MIVLPPPSPRAIAAAQLLCDGLTDEQIAHRLGRGKRTIRKYIGAARVWMGDAESREVLAYRFGRTQASRPASRRPRRTRDDEPTLW